MRDWNLIYLKRKKLIKNFEKAVETACTEDKESGASLGFLIRDLWDHFRLACEEIEELKKLNGEKK